MVIDNCIKEKASDKAFSRIRVLEFEIDALGRDYVRNGSGGITLEQQIGILEHIESEKTIWNYIASLIEKDY